MTTTTSTFAPSSSTLQPAETFDDGISAQEEKEEEEAFGSETEMKFPSSDGDDRVPKALQPQNAETKAVTLDYDYDESLEKLYEDYNVTQEYHPLQYIDQYDDRDESDSLLEVYNRVRNEEKQEENAHKRDGSLVIMGVALGSLLFLIVGAIGVVGFVLHKRRFFEPRPFNGSNSSNSSYSISDDEAATTSASVSASPRRRSSFNGGCHGNIAFVEEMYNLDNDSFLNSLESVNWPQEASSPQLSMYRSHPV